MSTNKVENVVDSSLFVNFGTRAFTCSVAESEISYLPGHALDLAKAAHVLQRMTTRFDWESGEFDDNDRKHASVGIDFITGMIAVMIECGGVA